MADFISDLPLLCPVNIANEIIYKSVPMQMISGAVFDQFLEEGWRMLSDCFLRHNCIMMGDSLIWTYPVRIKVPGLTLSKSQHKLKKKHDAVFKHYIQPILLTEEKNLLFRKHSTRLREKHKDPELASFLTPSSVSKPVAGWEIEVYDKNKLVACSYFHLGEKGMCGTYCFFDPDYNKHSLGTYTMLLELEIAARLGKEYYYPGYVQTTPSQFDYKLNFNNLEAYLWDEKKWQPRARRSLNATFE